MCGADDKPLFTFPHTTYLETCDFQKQKKRTHHGSLYFYDEISILMLCGVNKSLYDNFASAPRIFTALQQRAQRRTKNYLAECVRIKSIKNLIPRINKCDSPEADRKADRWPGKDPLPQPAVLFELPKSQRHYCLLRNRTLRNRYRHWVKNIRSRTQIGSKCRPRHHRTICFPF